MQTIKKEIAELWQKFLNAKSYEEKVERYYVNEEGGYLVIWTTLRVFFGHDAIGLIAVQQDPWGSDTLLPNNDWNVKSAFKPRKKRGENA